MKEHNLHEAREPARLVSLPTPPRPMTTLQPELPTVDIADLDVLESVPQLWPAAVTPSIWRGTLPGIMAGKRPPGRLPDSADQRPAPVRRRGLSPLGD
jgi:hypothetical protein